MQLIVVVEERNVPPQDVMTRIHRDKRRYEILQQWNRQRDRRAMGEPEILHIYTGRSKPRDRNAGALMSGMATDLSLKFFGRVVLLFVLVNL